MEVNEKKYLKAIESLSFLNIVGILGSVLLAYTNHLLIAAIILFATWLFNLIMYFITRKKIKVAPWNTTKKK